MHYDILVIDDNEDDREYYGVLLGRMDDIICSVRQADSGLAGFEQMRIKSPDCVLLDYSLPGHDGLNVLRKLRESHPAVPVIMLTGQGNEAIAVQAMKDGASDYINKSSITGENLRRSITSAIEYAVQEQKIIEQRKRIQQQAEELERINEELQTFTYIASHDLRSPLVNLRGFCGELHRSIDTIIPLLERVFPHLLEIEQEILRKETTQRIPKALTYINVAAEKMDRMTDAILKLSRVGRQKIALEKLNAKQIVDQCLASLAHQIGQTQTLVEMGDLPEVVCDRTSIEQIFGNLLDNAIKYLEPSRPGHLRIQGWKDNTYTTYSVQDNGRGIAKGDMHKVFEIFRRAGEVDNIPGEGMGMPYVRSIVKRYGGYIWCESELGEGTVFYFTLAHQDEQEAAA